jgi:hypothetical protein
VAVVAWQWNQKIQRVSAVILRCDKAGIQQHKYEISAIIGHFGGKWQWQVAVVAVAVGQRVAVVVWQ